MAKDLLLTIFYCLPSRQVFEKPQNTHPAKTNYWKKLTIQGFSKVQTSSTERDSSVLSNNKRHVKLQKEQLFQHLGKHGQLTTTSVPSSFSFCTSLSFSFSFSSSSSSSSSFFFYISLLFLLLPPLIPSLRLIHSLICICLSILLLLAF